MNWELNLVLSHFNLMYMPTRWENTTYDNPSFGGVF